MSTQNEPLRQVLCGLAAVPKSLPSSLHYDETGSRLFDVIVEQPAYYVTRNERWTLGTFAADMIAAVPTLCRDSGSLLEPAG
jgi:uncharacterized SAM-dependent methyltransferase